MPRSLTGTSRRASPSTITFAHLTTTPPYSSPVPPEHRSRTSITSRSRIAPSTQWYPICVVDKDVTDPKKPHAMQLLGMDLVVWNDGTRWNCFQDMAREGPLRATATPACSPSLRSTLAFLLNTR